MTKADYKHFSQALSVMAETKDKTLSSYAIAAYFKVLEPYPMHAVQSAIETAIATSRFWPQPADLVESIRGTAMASLEDRALVEANNILTHLRYNGATRTPDMQDPITKDLMTNRWPYRAWASRVIESELKWWVKEFCDAYRSFTRVTGNAMLDHAGLKALADMATRPLPQAIECRITTGNFAVNSNKDLN